MAINPTMDAKVILTALFLIINDNGYVSKAVAIKMVSIHVIKVVVPISLTKISWFWTLKAVWKRTIAKNSAKIALITCVSVFIIMFLLPYMALS
ncbi:hypothetical protein EGH90_10100 [Kaistella haifensis]|nr:hypothetical protein EGH90_10100 [Kaistella haifensis]